MTKARSAGHPEAVAIIGYSVAPIGRHQRRENEDAPLEHELGAKAAIAVCAAAGIQKQDVGAFIVANLGDYTKRGYFHTFAGRLASGVRSSIDQPSGIR